MERRIASKSQYLCPMQERNRIYLGLMISSIVILLLLQAAWLRSVNRGQKAAFRQETSLLLKSTVTALMDSLFLKDLRPSGFPPLPGIGRPDSMMNGMVWSDTTRIIHIDFIGDSSRVKETNDIHPANIQRIRVISGRSAEAADSLKINLRPLVQGVDTLKSVNSFIFRLNEETVNADVVQEAFNEVLRNNALPATATIRKARRHEQFEELPEKTIILEEVPVPPGSKIQAYFEDVEGFFLKNLLPHLVFSLLVLGFIGGSLLIMYRNMIKQQQLNLLKNDIISNITHELKTPVATVSLVLESLENFSAKDQPETRKEYLQIAKNELKRLTSMTEKILNSTVHGQRSGAHKEAVDLEKLVKENVNTLKPILESEGFDFELDQKGVGFVVQGQAEQLSMVIFNLLDNAIKYSKEIKKIKVTLSEQGNFVSLSVEDKGIGIPEGYQKEIFGKFIRVPQKDIHDVKGYGLGLAQVAEVVKAHGGKISLESQIGQGSVFTIKLPKS
jgi:two-component system, OmpR family, phosphate regulon sensor histidine kinase PhoR